MDTGTGYGRAVTPAFDRDLVEVGPGTRAGELLRRYWHPVARGDEATDLPVVVRLLGEDLVLFRDLQGRAGLVVPRCCHRGTSLLYGKVENDGIRCCYHGWLFDGEGNCLDQPCEPDRGRNLASYELAALATVFGALAWGLTASHRRRERKRMLGMRDSALW